MTKKKGEPAGSAGLGLGSEGIGLGDLVIEKPDAKLTVVFPYLKAKAQGNELLYAIRSLERNFREDFQIVVIGDAEEWFGEEIIHLQADAVSENPQVDTIHKLKLAIADERVSDDFIWMNDDIYFNSPVMLADIQILKAQGKLKYTPDANGVYDINRNKTVDALKSLHFGKWPNHNYDTHTPFYYKKEKLVMLFEEVPELNTEGLLVPSLYYNIFHCDFTPMQFDGINGHYQLRLVSKNTDQATFDRYVVGKKFLNNAESGYNSVLVSYLEKEFGRKCSFEK